MPVFWCVQLGVFVLNCFSIHEAAFVLSIHFMKVFIWGENSSCILVPLSYNFLFQLKCPQHLDPVPNVSFAFDSVNYTSTNSWRLQWISVLLTEIWLDFALATHNPGRYYPPVCYFGKCLKFFLHSWNINFKHLDQIDVRIWLKFNSLECESNDNWLNLNSIRVACNVIQFSFEWNLNFSTL